MGNAPSTSTAAKTMPQKIQPRPSSAIPRKDQQRSRSLISSLDTTTNSVTTKPSASVSRQKFIAKAAYGNSSVKVVQGDLTTTQADVIVVCSTSEYLRKSILAAASDEIRTSYEQQSAEPSAPSLISVATAGHFPSQQIYFLAWRGGTDDAALRKSIHDFVSSAMERAETDGYQSIAFPAIGCGKIGASIPLVAESMVQAARLQSSERGISVSFIIQQEREDIYDEFQKQIASSELEITSPDVQSVSTTIGNSKIEVVIGDITLQQVDAIIVSASSEFLTGIVLNAAGDQVKSEHATKSSNDPNALVIVTSSGQLPSKRIFFSKWKPNQDESILRQSLIDFVWNVIQHVIQYQCTSIALPAIGCGKYGFPVDVVAKTMMNEVQQQIQNRNLSLNVRFVITSDKETVYDEFCKQVKLLGEENEKTIEVRLPSTWEKATPGQIRYPMSNTSSEYQAISTNFAKMMADACKSVIKIERIQNERCYKQYAIHREDFLKRLANDTEKLLYHGCPEEAANSITEGYFNRSFAGKNGVMYGMGVYFSSNAAYSHTYAVPNAEGERFMFLSRVVIGKTATGNSSMKTQPVGFDSTTDGNHIFVIYHDAQAFAEYLITYT